MSTIKQRKAIKKIMENGGNITKAMREVGYSEATINNPSNLTESKGYKEILNKCGLTEELVVSSLVNDIESKPGRRYSELSLAAEILGMRKRQQELLVNAEQGVNFGSSEVVMNTAILLNEYFKKVR